MEEQTKRERDEDEVVVRTVLQKTKHANFVPYMNLSQKEKERLGLDGIGFLGHDMVKYIGTLEPGILLSLSLQSKFFYELTMSEFIWKNMFQRHFPIDYTFCNGQLPFYIITKDHIFYNVRWTDASINTPGWKRFYLHVRNNYVQTFTYRFNVFSEFPPFDIMYKLVLGNANALNDQKYGHRSMLAELFCSRIVYFLYGSTEIDILSAEQYENIYMSRTNGYPWLQKYFSDLNHGKGNTESLFSDEDALLWRNFVISGVWNTIHPVNINVLRQKLLVLFITVQHAYRNLCVSSLYCKFTSSIALEEERRFMEMTVMSSLIFKTVTTANGFVPTMLNVGINTPDTDEALFNVLIRTRGAPIWAIVPRTAALRAELDVSPEFRSLIVKYNDVPRKANHRINLVQCMTCNISNVPMNTCGTCKNVVYCGVSCQREDWINGHAEECGQ